MGVFRHSAAAAAALVGGPLFLGALALRPGWRSGWRERLGRGPDAAGAIWLHAASVGEVAASSRLVSNLHAAGHRLLLSTTSATGRELAGRLHPELPHRLAPLDHPWCIDPLLRRARPRGLVLIETEVWPVWIGACAREGVPVVIVSGRISDRSFPRYRKLGSWLARTLGRVDAIGARTEIDRERFVALGAPAERVSVTGDLKLDPPEVLPAPDPELATWLGDGPLVVAGSTHPGEEAALLEAQTRWEESGGTATLVLAPRYPKRRDEVVALVRKAGRRARVRSEGAAPPLARGEVGVLDTLGELSAVYSRATVAYVGGTLVSVGGHNVLEPVIAGAPVLYGPHVSNARHAAELLESVGAGQTVGDVLELAHAVGAALSDPSAARERAEAGRRALEAHRDSSVRAADLVLRTLGREGGA